MSAVVSLIDARTLRHNPISGTGAAYDRLNAARQDFLDKFENGRATATDVLQFILLEDDCDYETIPTSEGAQWLRENPGRFAETVGDVDAFVETVLGLFHKNATGDEEHERGAWLAGYEFLRTLVSEPELMLRLSPEWRECMVREVWPEVGSNGHEWIAAAIQTGVPREVIARAIVERIRRTHPKPGMFHYVASFLEYGHERDPCNSPVPSTLRRLGCKFDSDEYREHARNPREAWVAIYDFVRARLDAIRRKLPTPALSYQLIMHFARHESPTEEQKWEACFRGLREWDVLNGFELEQALRLCEQLLPGCLVGLREPMARRLDDRTVDELMRLSLSRIDTVSGIPDSEIARKTLVERRAIAARIAPVEPKARHMVKPTAQFLFRILNELPKCERRSFYRDTIVRVLHDAPSPDVYAAWRQLNLVENDLDYELRGWLKEDGYEVGTIQRVPFGSGWQLVVDIRGQRYVQQRGSHRYHLAEGDLVTFDPSRGTRLTHYVVAVNFVPVLKDAD